MQPFFTSILTTTFGGQFAPKKGGQFDRIFQKRKHPIFTSFLNKKIITKHHTA